MTVRLTRRAALMATAMASGLWCHTGRAADESEDPLEKAIDQYVGSLQMTAKAISAALSKS